MHDLDTTIVAVATPPGRGGVGCVRLSGPRAAEIALGLFAPGRSGPPEPGGPPRFGRFLGRDGKPVDHGLAVLFEPARSFTGEDAAELWPHGSPPVLAHLVEAAVAAGAVAAGPGEFAYRALRRGRIDLARAEAVRDLVAARTLFQARTALAQAEGELSRRLRPLREGLADLVMRIEAAIEFAADEETHLPPERLAAGVGEAARQCRALLEGFRAGRIAREGATVAIAGAPNVGKSTLFNRLLGRDRAIVASLPGTTRDVLEETFDLRGIPVRLVDTAGLREAADEIEEEGVRRAREAVGAADLVLLVLDATAPAPAGGRGIPAAAPAERTMPVLNKCDLPAAEGTEGLAGALRVSARTGEGIGDLLAAVAAALAGSGPIEHPVMSDARHGQALLGALAALEGADRAVASGVPDELVLEDLRDALHHVGSITGEMSPDELYDRIFSAFCVGK